MQSIPRNVNGDAVLTLTAADRNVTAVAATGRALTQAGRVDVLVAEPAGMRRPAVPGVR